MNKAALAINPGCSDAACCCGHSRGAAAEENPTDRLREIRWRPRILVLTSRHFAEDCEISVMSKEKTSSIEYRSAEGKADRIPGLVADLVQTQGRCPNFR